jgi:hypothetical protein
MSSTSRDGTREGVEFIAEDDGSVTARDIETGLARGGDTRAEALTALAEVLRLEHGGGEAIDDPDEFLQTEMNVNPDDLTDHDELPEFMQ